VASVDLLKVGTRTIRGHARKGDTAIAAKLADILEKLWIFGGQSPPDLF
jgi:hypothetical protein